MAFYYELLISKALKYNQTWRLGRDVLHAHCSAKSSTQMGKIWRTGGHD